jgi:enamine deaminase RidA (YjgF/YER057c/UK114 family)
VTRRAIYSRSKFEELAGYSRAVVDGEWIFVSGTAGYDIARDRFPDDPGEQARLALRTVAAALAEAQASLADIVRVRIYLADAAYVGAVSRVLRETFSDPRPTNTTIVCGFADPGIRVEIEATALKRNPRPSSSDAPTARSEDPGNRAAPRTIPRVARE